MERVLADIDADDGSLGCLRHGALLVFGAHYQLKTLAGQEHGRTIPLGDAINAPARAPFLGGTLACALGASTRFSIWNK